MRHVTIAALMGASLLTACVSAPKSASDSLDAVARDYVALTLEIGEREPG
jgi:starvation-inducible outer membrane lipoprotein